MLCRMTSPETKTILAFSKPASQGRWLDYGAAQKDTAVHKLIWTSGWQSSLIALEYYMNSGLVEQDPIKFHVGLQFSARCHRSYTWSTFQQVESFSSLCDYIIYLD